LPGRDILKPSVRSGTASTPFDFNNHSPSPHVDSTKLENQRTSSPACGNTAKATAGGGREKTGGGEIAKGGRDRGRAAEAELLRQIAAEEERERQEAEAAERERVAEEIQKLEEEECQRREAEHRAEVVRQVQAPESPMRVDDGSGDDGDAEEEAEKKGKEKEKDGREMVGGSGRCKACRKEETACKINLGEIEKWRKSTEKGKVYKKAPPATSCQRCMEVRRKPCILPATEECRRHIGKLLEAEGRCLARQYESPLSYSHL